jgi:hypothetical protein
LLLTAWQVHGQAAAAVITGFAYSPTTGIYTNETGTHEVPGPAIVWTNGVVPGAYFRTNLAALTPPPPPESAPTSLKVWRVKCPYCSTAFNTGAVFDRVSGGTSNPDGSTTEHHSMRCNCSNLDCAKQINWMRDVIVPKVVAVPINP